MTSAYKLDAHGSSLVTDGNGNLVAVLTQNIRAQVTVKTFNPACALAGPNGEPASGWYVAWRVFVGGGGMVESGVSHSAGEAQENTSETYTGTIRPLSPTVEVHLQLRAWRNKNDQQVVMYEYSPNGVILNPFNISFSAEIDGETLGSDFAGTNPSSEQGAWVATSPYYRIIGTYDFEEDKWSLAGSIVSP